MCECDAATSLLPQQQSESVTPQASLSCRNSSLRTVTPQRLCCRRTGSSVCGMHWRNGRCSHHAGATTYSTDSCQRWYNRNAPQTRETSVLHNRDAGARRSVDRTTLQRLLGRPSASGWSTCTSAPTGASRLKLTPLIRQTASEKHCIGAGLRQRTQLELSSQRHNRNCLPDALNISAVLTTPHAHGVFRRNSLRSTPSSSERLLTSMVKQCCPRRTRATVLQPLGHRKSPRPSDQWAQYVHEHTRTY